VDYLFRKLAVVYMSEEERRDMGILTVSERLQPTLPGVEEAVVENSESTLELLPPEDRAPSAAAAPAPAPPAPTPAPPVREREVVLCNTCGDIMQRAGSCYACPSCGSTSGCS
jgi:ribonucleoside-diphosphate reductase alpha chain